jgi:hypothetical protein
MGRLGVPCYGWHFDTGATATVINVGMLVALGYDPALVPERI